MYFYQSIVSIVHLVTEVTGFSFKVKRSKVSGWRITQLDDGHHFPTYFHLHKFSLNIIVLLC